MVESDLPVGMCLGRWLLTVWRWSVCIGDGLLMVGLKGPSTMVLRTFPDMAAQMPHHDEEVARALSTGQAQTNP